MTTADRTHMLAVLVHEDAHHVQVSQHLPTPESYAETILDRGATERSAREGQVWHRWARFTLADVEYVVHDPQHHLTDPCGPEQRIAELMNMMGRVVRADDMDATEKVRELSRLTARMRKIAPTPDPTDEDLNVIADALAGSAVSSPPVLP